MRLALIMQNYAVVVTVVISSASLCVCTEFCGVGRRWFEWCLHVELTLATAARYTPNECYNERQLFVSVRVCLQKKTIPEMPLD